MTNKSKQLCNRRNSKLKNQALIVQDSRHLNQDTIPLHLEDQKFSLLPSKEWIVENQLVENKFTGIRFIIQLLTK